MFPHGHFVQYNFAAGGLNAAQDIVYVPSCVQIGNSAASARRVAFAFGQATACPVLRMRDKRQSVLVGGTALDDLQIPTEYLVVKGHRSLYIGYGNVKSGYQIFHCPLISCPAPNSH